MIQSLLSEESSNSAGILLKGEDGDDYTHLSLKSFRSAPPFRQQSVFSKKRPEIWMCWSLSLPPWAGLGDCSVMNVRGEKVMARGGPWHQLRSCFALICRTKIPGCPGLRGDWGWRVFSIVSLSLGAYTSHCLRSWDRRVSPSPSHPGSNGFSTIYATRDGRYLLT